MVRLDRDLLYEIAEKMVVGQAAWSEGEPVSKLFEFMMASRGCKLAFLSQFSKVERFVLTSSPGSYFYVSSSSGKINYCGDFGKDKPFVAFLIQHEKFRPKHLTFSEVIGSDERLSKDVMDLKGLSSMEYLSVLLRLDDCGLDVAAYHGRDLLLEKLCVVDKAYSLAHLDKILALNSKQLEISIDGVRGLHCLPEIRKNQLVNCSRTEALSLIYISECCCRSEEFPVSEWIDLLRYILACCPILKKLDVSYKLHEKCKVSANSLCDCFLQAIKVVKEDVLPPVLREGCFIRVEFTAHPDLCVFEDIQDSNHDLFDVGAYRELDDWSKICRVVAVDTRAEVSFMIQLYDDGSSFDDQSSISFWDSSGDDDHENEDEDIVNDVLMLLDDSDAEEEQDHE